MGGGPWAYDIILYKSFKTMGDNRQYGQLNMAEAFLTMLELNAAKVRESNVLYAGAVDVASTSEMVPSSRYIQQYCIQQQQQQLLQHHQRKFDL